MSTPNPLLDPEAVAQYLGVQVDTLKTWRRRREGPPYIHVNSQRCVRYRLRDVDAWLDEQTVAS